MTKTNLLKIFLTLLFVSHPTLGNTETKKVKELTIEQKLEILTGKSVSKEEALDRRIKIILKAPSKSEKELSLKDYKSLFQRGGDIIGNGGDLARSQIITNTRNDLKKLINLLGQQVSIEQEVVELNKLHDLTDERVILVVDDIQLDTNSDTSLYYYASKDLILFKKSFVDHANENKKDLRQLIIHLLLKASDINDSEFKISLELYALLDPVSIDNENLTPNCTFNRNLFHVVNNVLSFDESYKSHPRQSAMTECTQKGLRDCHVNRVVETSNMFGENIEFEVTYSGTSTKVQLKENKCNTSITCKEVYDFAPLGQVDSTSYNQNENKIIKYCRD